MLKKEGKADGGKYEGKVKDKNALAEVRWKCVWNSHLFLSLPDVHRKTEWAQP